MLEALVSSRIRRALFEHILTHPEERFYLRGLAKHLNLSVSPLRRELKRLEAASVLKVVQEGSLRFYAVDTTSPIFLQLQSASQPAPSPEPSAPSPQPTPVGTLSIKPTSIGWRSALSGPALVGVAVVGMVLALGVAGLLYSRMTDQRLASRDTRPLEARTTKVTVVVPPASASGVMRGRRWQVVPGGFGGFSSASSEEAY